MLFHLNLSILVLTFPVFLAEYRVLHLHRTGFLLTHMFQNAWRINGCCSVMLASATGCYLMYHKLPQMSSWEIGQSSQTENSENAFFACPVGSSGLQCAAEVTIITSRMPCNKCSQQFWACVSSAMCLFNKNQVFCSCFWRRDFGFNILSNLTCSRVYMWKPRFILRTILPHD